MAATATKLLVLLHFSWLLCFGSCALRRLRAVSPRSGAAYEERAAKPGRCGRGWRHIFASLCGRRRTGDEKGSLFSGIFSCRECAGRGAGGPHDVGPSVGQRPPPRAGAWVDAAELAIAEGRGFEFGRNFYVTRGLSTEFWTDFVGACASENMETAAAGPRKASLVLKTAGKPRGGNNRASPSSRARTTFSAQQHEPYGPQDVQLPGCGPRMPMVPAVEPCCFDGFASPPGPAARSTNNTSACCALSEQAFDEKGSSASSASLSTPREWSFRTVAGDSRLQVTSIATDVTRRRVTGQVAKTYAGLLPTSTDFEDQHELVPGRRLIEARSYLEMRLLGQSLFSPPADENAPMESGTDRTTGTNKTACKGSGCEDADRSYGASDSYFGNATLEASAVARHLSWSSASTCSTRCTDSPCRGTSSASTPASFTWRGSPRTSTSWEMAGDIKNAASLGGLGLPPRAVWRSLRIYDVLSAESPAKIGFRYLVFWEAGTDVGMPAWLHPLAEAAEKLEFEALSFRLRESLGIPAPVADWKPVPFLSARLGENLSSASLFATVDCAGRKRPDAAGFGSGEAAKSLNFQPGRRQCEVDDYADQSLFDAELDTVTRTRLDRTTYRNGVRFSAEFLVPKHKLAADVAVLSGKAREDGLLPLAELGRCVLLQSETLCENSASKRVSGRVRAPVDFRGLPPIAADFEDRHLFTPPAREEGASRSCDGTGSVGLPYTVARYNTWVEPTTGGPKDMSKLWTVRKTLELVGQGDDGGGEREKKRVRFSYDLIWLETTPGSGKFVLDERLSAIYRYALKPPTEMGHRKEFEEIRRLLGQRWELVEIQ